MASKAPSLLPPRPPKPAFLSAECISKQTPPSTGQVTQLESVYTELKGTGRSLLFPEVAEHHSQSLPMVVEVRSSLYGIGGSTTMLDGELLHLHFLKETDCVKVQVNKRPKKSIPINSTLQFSALYNPTENMDEARQGMVFKSVSRLMSAKVLPRVVCVTSVPTTRTACSLVTVGDVLAPKDTERKRGGKGHMTCHHIQRKENIKLKESWDIQFSTNPELVKLHLPELLDHVTLPIETVVSMQDTMQWKEVKKAFPNQVCTVLSRNVEASVIATYSQKEAVRSILEIPITFSLLSVRIIQMSSVVRHQLVEETHKLLVEFVPEMVDAWISDDVASNQSLLLRKYVCQNNPTFGITLVRPDSLDNEYDYVSLEPRREGMTKPIVSAVISKLQLAYLGHIKLILCFTDCSS